VTVFRAYRFEIITAAPKLQPSPDRPLVPSERSCRRRARALQSDKVTVLRAYRLEIIAAAPNLHAPLSAGSETTSRRA
jgi:hypothetical protein